MISLEYAFFDNNMWGQHFANGARSPIETEIFSYYYEMSPWLKDQLIGLRIIIFIGVYN